MSDNLLWMQNPALATALRRRQEGAALMQAGMDTSPIRSPWQGLARVAQGLLGGYEARKGDEAISSAQQARQAMLAKLLSEGEPSAPAPMPSAVPQPVTQAPLAPPQYAPLIEKASQETGVPVPILTALYAQESGFRPDARNPQSTAAGMGQILASTAANPGYGMPPLADADRLDPAKAIPWSAQYLAARAKAMGVTDWTNPQQAATALRAYGENTPEYAQAVLGRAGMGGAPAPQAVPQPDPMAYVRSLEAKAQAAAAMGETGLASIMMQRAQLAQRAALARQPQPKNPIQVRGPDGKLVWMMPDQAVGMEAPDTRPQTTINMPKGQAMGQIPPGHMVIEDPASPGGFRMIPIAGGPADVKQAEAQAKKDKADESTMRTGNIVVEDIGRIGKLIDDAVLPATGLGASTLSGMPGTAAHDVARLLDGIKANIAFDKLQEMRASSPTGGALGSVSDKENALLQSVYGSLEQSQSPEQFKKNLQRLKTVYMDIIHGAGKWKEVAPGQSMETPTAAPAAPSKPLRFDRNGDPIRD